MVQNPLQQYFRQPKVFVSLPSQGVYSEPGTFTGDVKSVPIFGMTGMDEIMFKTPDALITGESTVRVIQSCCPNITNAWNISNLDVDSLLVGIRIATYGNTMNMTHICNNCNTDNTYEVNISDFLDHFAHCEFNSQTVVDDLTIRIRPLTYKQVTEFNLENFGLQKRLVQAADILDGDERAKNISAIYEDLGLLQNKIMLAGIEQVETPAGVVTEHGFIKEWLEKSDKKVFDAVRTLVNTNVETWKIPATKVKCDTCGTENSFEIDLDQSSFFANA